MLPVVTSRIGAEGLYLDGLVPGQQVHDGFIYPKDNLGRKFGGLIATSESNPIASSLESYELPSFKEATLKLISSPSTYHTSIHTGLHTLSSRMSSSVNTQAISNVIRMDRGRLIRMGGRGVEAVERNRVEGIGRMERFYDEMKGK